MKKFYEEFLWVREKKFKLVREVFSWLEMKWDKSFSMELWSRSVPRISALMVAVLWEFSCLAMSKSNLPWNRSLSSIKVHYLIIKNKLPHNSVRLQSYKFPFFWYSSSFQFFH